MTIRKPSAMVVARVCPTGYSMGIGGKRLHRHSPAMTTFTVFIAKVQIQTACGYIDQHETKCVGVDEVQGAAEAITVMTNRLNREACGCKVLDVLSLRPVEIVRVG